VNEDESEDEIEDDTKDETGDETGDETEDKTEDENEDIMRHIYTYDNPFLICYYSHNIDWSNTRVIKTASNFDNFLVLTDDGKVK